MAGRRKNNSSRNRARAKLLEMGVGGMAIGAALLLGPAIMSANPLIRSFAPALRVPGLMALALGAALIGVHLLLNRQPSAPPALQQEPEWAKPAQKKAEPTPAWAQSQATQTPEQAKSWSAQVFNDIEWRRFEAVCEALFGQAGFETKAQSHGADGGVDIWLHSRHSLGPAAVVQCKHWLGKPVGVKEMREFYGVMASHKLQRGTYATSSTFTAEALRFAKDNGISALDGTGLLALIAKRTPEQQQALLATAYEGEYWKPTCASCGVKMVDREQKKGGNSFWGCPRYPRCRSTLPMRAAARAA